MSALFSAASRRSIGSALQAMIGLAGLVPCLLLASCGGAVKQAAKEAAPAAVEGAAEEADDPETRDNLATLLGDPEIHEAVSRLSSAIVEGALNGLSDAERTAELQRVADAVVAHMGAAFGRSLQRDIGPRLSAIMGEAVAQSIERALDARTEERVQALAHAVSRGVMSGLGESMFDPVTGRPAPEIELVVGRFAREVTRQAAFGVDDAVRDAETGDVPPDGDAEVLAALGRSSRLLLALPALLLIGAAVLGVVLSAALLWALFRLRQQRRVSRELERMLRERAEPRPVPSASG